MQVVKRLPTLELWPMTPKEQTEAGQLSHLQKQQFMNHMTVHIQEKINMSAGEPNYIEKQEYLRGCIETYQYLLDLSL